MILNSCSYCEPQQFTFQNDISKDEGKDLPCKGGGTEVPEGVEENPSPELLNSLRSLSNSTLSCKGRGIVKTSRFTRRKAAFTLAEVLITLGIIGVVAAMTLPTLVGNYKNKELSTRAKKTYSLISQALQKYQSDNGTVGDITGLFDTSKNSADVTTAFSKYFKATRVCTSKTQKGCDKFYYEVAYASPLYDAEGSATGSGMYTPKFLLPDGALIGIKMQSSCIHPTTSTVYNPDGTPQKDADGNVITNTYNENSCGSIYFDTNGPAKPNQFGADAFELRVRNNSKLWGWGKTGWDSLNEILSGKDPVYSKYSKGDKFNF